MAGEINQVWNEASQVIKIIEDQVKVPDFF